LRFHALHHTAGSLIAPHADARFVQEFLGHSRITLGLIWLLDGALQFQSFMYSHGFLKEVIKPSAAMQPAWIGHPMISAAHFAGHNLSSASYAPPTSSQSARSR